MVGHAIHQAKLLLHRQTDHTAKRDALLLQIVLRLDERLLLRLQLHPRAQSVDLRRQPGVLLIERQLIQRLSGCHLGLHRGYARLVGDGQQIIGADGEHDGIAGVLVAELRSLNILPGGTK